MFCISEIELDERDEIIKSSRLEVYHETAQEAAKECAERNGIDTSIADKYGHVCEERDMLLKEVEALKAQLGEAFPEDATYLVNRNGKVNSYKSKQEAISIGRNLARNGIKSTISRLLGEIVPSYTAKFIDAQGNETAI